MSEKNGKSDDEPKNMLTTGPQKQQPTNNTTNLKNKPHASIFFFLVWFGSNYTRVVEESARTSVAPPLFYIRVRSNVSWPILSLSLFLSYLLIFLLSKRRKTLTRNCFSHRWKTRRKKKSRTREKNIYKIGMFSSHTQKKTWPCAGSGKGVFWMRVYCNCKRTEF